MTGWKTWAALEEVTAANMNSYVRDQTVQVFSSAASRAAAIASPTRGLVSFLTDGGALEVYYGATTGWAKPWNQPWGPVTFNSLAATATYASPTWGFPAFSWTGTPIANRFYRATIDFGWGPGTLTGQVDFGLGTAAGTGVGRVISLYEDTNTAPRQTCHVSVFTTTGAAMTRGLTIRKISGGGNIDVLAQSTLHIEDLGPSSTTAPAA